METIRLAGCILRDEQGRILLLHRNTPKRTQWEIPGGTVEKDEDIAEAARREVREELGVAVAELKQLGTKSFSEDGRTLEFTWFSATVADGTPQLTQYDEDEDYDDLRYFTLDELEKLQAELSLNTLNFLQELRAGQITL